MPSSAAILAGLTTIADELRAIAVGWEVALVLALVAFVVSTHGRTARR